MAGSFSVAALGYPLYAAVSMASVATIILIRRKSVKQEPGDRVPGPRDDFLAGWLPPGRPATYVE